MTLHTETVWKKIKYNLNYFLIREIIDPTYFEYKETKLLRQEETAPMIGIMTQ